MGVVEGLWLAQRTPGPAPAPGEVAWVDLTAISLHRLDMEGNDHGPDLIRVDPGDFLYINNFVDPDSYVAGRIETVTPEALFITMALDANAVSAGAPAITRDQQHVLLSLNVGLPPTVPTWITVDDLSVVIGMDLRSDEWAQDVCAAANVWAYERRQSYGYTDSPTAPPNERVKLGTSLYARVLWNERALAGDTTAAFEGIASFTGSGMGQIHRLLGIPKALAV